MAAAYLSSAAMEPCLPGMLRLRDMIVAGLVSNMTCTSAGLAVCWPCLLTVPHSLCAQLWDHSSASACAANQNYTFLQHAAAGKAWASWHLDPSTQCILST